jgi:hypothetical protein
MNAKAQSQRVDYVALAGGPDDILQIGLEGQAGNDVKVIIGLKDRFMRLDTSGADAVGQAKRLHDALDFTEGNTDVL